MSEIKLKINELNDSIEALKKLKTECQEWDTTSPDTVGGGQTVNELEAIAALYKKLNTHFIDLVSNTVSFMENVKESFEESDIEAAKKIAAAAGIAQSAGSNSNRTPWTNNIPHPLGDNPNRSPFNHMGTPPGTSPFPGVDTMSRDLNK